MDDNRFMVFCPSCGFLGSLGKGESIPPCPKCNSKMLFTSVDREIWTSLSKEAKEATKSHWINGDLGIFSEPYSTRKTDVDDIKTYFMYVCPDCRKVFKIAGNGKKAKCTKCKESALVEMGITDQAWKAFSQTEKENYISEILDEPEIIEVEDEIEESPIPEKHSSFFDVDVPNNGGSNIIQSNNRYGQGNFESAGYTDTYNGYTNAPQQNYNPPIVSPNSGGFKNQVVNAEYNNNAGRTVRWNSKYATYSMLLGFFAVLTITIYIGIFLAALSIFYACKAYKDSGRLTSKAVIGIACSAIAVLFMLIAVNNRKDNKEASKAPTENNEISTVKTDENSNKAVTTQENDGIWASSPTELSEFEYKIDPYEKRIVIEDFIGEDTKIWVPSTFRIDGETYATDFSENDGVFALEGKITSVILDEGIKNVANNTFNSCSDLKYLYLPSTIVSARNGGIFGYTHDYKEVYYGGNDTQWYIFTSNTDEEKLKYLPVYVNSRVLTTGEVTKGKLYNKENVVAEEIPEDAVPEPTLIAAEEFMASAESVTYDDLRRYPEKFDNKAICLSIKAKDVEPDGWFFQGGMLCVIPGTSNELIVYDGRQIREPRIMEGDVIKIYALGDGLGVIKQKQGTGLLAKTVDKYEVPQIVIMKVENDSNTKVDTSTNAMLNTSSSATGSDADDSQEKAREAGEKAADKINQLIESE